MFPSHPRLESCGKGTSSGAHHRIVGQQRCDAPLDRWTMLALDECLFDFIMKLAL
jgi:hypothetical protein